MQSLGQNNLLLNQLLVVLRSGGPGKPLLPKPGISNGEALPHLAILTVSHADAHALVEMHTATNTLEIM